MLFVLHNMYGGDNMKTASEIGKVVRSLRGDMSLRDFALKCGISHTTLDNIEKWYDFRTGKPVQAKMATLQKISDAMMICAVPRHRHHINKTPYIVYLIT